MSSQSSTRDLSGSSLGSPQIRIASRSIMRRVNMTRCNIISLELKMSWLTKRPMGNKSFIHQSRITVMRMLALLHPLQTLEPRSLSTNPPRAPSRKPKNLSRVRVLIFSRTHLNNRRLPKLKNRLFLIKLLLLTKRRSLQQGSRARSLSLSKGSPRTSNLQPLAPFPWSLPKNSLSRNKIR